MKSFVFFLLVIGCLKGYGQTFDQLNNMALKAAQEKKYDESIALYNRSLALDKGNYFIFNQISKLYYYKGDLDKSISYCDSTLKVMPKDTSALYQRGHCYMEKAEYENGLADLTQVFILKNKMNSDASFNMGKCYAGLKNFDKAIDSYLTTLKIEPNDKYSFYELGYCYASLSDKKNALTYYSKAIAADPNYFSPTFGRALLYAAQIKDFKKAHHDFDRSLEINPKNKEAYLYNARLFSEEKEFGKAKDVLDKLISLYPDYGQGYLERGLVWYNIGILNMVCRDLDKAISLGNKDAVD